VPSVARIVNPSPEKAFPTAIASLA
jgi:hypothetical protein